MKNQDWKLKYSDLKLKFHDAVDVAFRLGFEQGAQNAQVQQAQQAEATAQQAAAGQIPGQEGQPGEMPGQESQQPSDGSELDQHIGTLESMLQKSDPADTSTIVMKKSLEGIKAFKSSLKQASDLRKSEKAIAEIGKHMKPKFTLGKAATKNMGEHGKKALNSQERLVSDLMKAMSEEEAKATESITKTLDLEQILKP
jgi:hypothetical protein